MFGKSQWLMRISFLNIMVFRCSENRCFPDPLIQKQALTGSHWFGIFRTSLVSSTFSSEAGSDRIPLVSDFQKMRFVCSVSDSLGQFVRQFPQLPSRTSSSMGTLLSKHFKLNGASPKYSVFANIIRSTHILYIKLCISVKHRACGWFSSVAVSRAHIATSKIRKNGKP